MQSFLGQPELLSAAALATCALQSSAVDGSITRFHSHSLHQGLIVLANLLAEAGGAHRPKPTTNLKEKNNEEDCCVTGFDSSGPHGFWFNSEPGPPGQTPPEGK